MKALFLKLLPYLISIVGGAIVYTIAEQHLGPDAGMYDLITGMASGLLSVPLIFICYEGVNRICSQNLRKTLFEHLSFEVNSAIIGILSQLKTIVGHSEPLCNDTLERLLSLTPEEIQPRIILDSAAAQRLQECKDELLSTIQKHTHGHSDILSSQETETLLCICKESGTLGKEVLYQLELPEPKRDLQHVVLNTHLLITHISDWLDESENEALVNHRHFRFLQH